MVKLIRLVIGHLHTPVVQHTYSDKPSRGRSLIYLTIIIPYLNTLNFNIPYQLPFPTTHQATTLFSKYSATGHLFADDVQAYVHGPPSSQLLLDSKIELLSNDLNSWMSSN